MGHGRLDYPHSRLARWLDVVLDLLYPPRCAGCGTPGGHWCASCASQVHRLRPPLCQRCGRPTTEPLPSCPDCERNHKQFSARSYASYRGPVARAIVSLKYRPSRRLASMMGGWLAELVRESGWRGDLVVPVPLSRGRFRERGYNQAALVAQQLARRLGVPSSAQAVTRHRETSSQVGLNSSQRRSNVAGAFEADGQIVAHRAVLLIDDLYTTGSTIEACGRALIAGGAVDVKALTVGRALSAHHWLSDKLTHTEV